MAKLILRQASRIGSYKKPWVAEITGTDSKFGFKRSFLTATDTEHGGNWTFELPDGIYESCNRNSKGDERRAFWLVENGEKTEITAEQVEERIGKRPDTSQGRRFEFYKSEGDLFEHDGGWWYCYKSSGFHTEDGLSFGLSQDEGFVPGDHCFARPATESEVTAEKASREKLETEKAAKVAKSEAFKELKVIANELREQATCPERVEKISASLQAEFTSSFMNSLGNKLALEDGIAIWILYYNGRSDDNLSDNNYGSYWIAWRAPWNEETAWRIRAAEAKKNGQPEPVRVKTQKLASELVEQAINDGYTYVQAGLGLAELGKWLKGWSTLAVDYKDGVFETDDKLFRHRRCYRAEDVVILDWTASPVEYDKRFYSCEQEHVGRVFGYTGDRDKHSIVTMADSAFKNDWHIVDEMKTRPYKLQVTISDYATRKVLDSFGTIINSGS